jgi:hypothetical protein
MNDIYKPEQITQDQAIALFRDELLYCYLGESTGGVNQPNIEVASPRRNLEREEGCLH